MRRAAQLAIVGLLLAGVVYGAAVVPAAGVGVPVSGTTGTFTGLATADSFTATNADGGVAYQAVGGSRICFNAAKTSCMWHDGVNLQTTTIGNSLVHSGSIITTGGFSTPGNPTIQSQSGVKFRAGPSASGSILITDVDGVDIGNGTGDEADGTLNSGTVTTGAAGFLQFQNRGAAPTGTDCDADAEAGRFFLDTTNERLYVCNGAARGWDYVALTD